MIFFFHHYELPAILRRGAHIVGDGEVLDRQLELEILNRPAHNANDNPNEPVQNTEINISANDASENNVPENSNDFDTEERESNINSTPKDGVTSLRQRHGEVINTGDSSSAPSPDVEFPVNDLDNRTS